jgi:hypothetical protein
VGTVDISNFYAYIHRVLRDDPKIRSMIGLNDSSSLEDAATRIQKRKKPQDLVSKNHPVITFYKNAGARGTNYLEYKFIVDFDVYTQNDVELALNINDRIIELFDDQYIGIAKGSFFKGQYITGAEDDTDMENKYKYFTQIGYTIGIEE